MHFSSLFFTLSLIGMNPSTLMVLPSAAETMVWSLCRFLTDNSMFLIRSFPMMLIEAPMFGQSVLAIAVILLPNVIESFATMTLLPWTSMSMLWRVSISSLRGMWLGEIFWVNLLILGH